jgi:hypothetical protein
MSLDVQQYKKKHLDFWNLTEVQSPLIGFTVGTGSDSWSYWQDNKAVSALLSKEEIFPQDISPEDFVYDQLKYLESTKEIKDDVCRTAMPLASLPWIEAILGCPVYASGANMKSGKILDNAASLNPLPFDQNNPWLITYLKFIEVYKEAFGNRFPVAQSVIRGPSDLACALMGAEEATMALATEPEEMLKLLDYVTTQLVEFLKVQLNHLPQFRGGYVIGQYEIWAPDPAIRFQEDFSVMYSPQLYANFLKAMDERLADLTPYNLIHLHSSSLFLIDQFLEISNIKAFQVTKDPGGATLSSMIPALQKIQEASKPLIVKGQFDQVDLNMIRDQLSVKGLCIQPVVGSHSEARQMLMTLRTNIF